MKIFQMTEEDMTLLLDAAKAAEFEVIGSHVKVGVRIWNEDRTRGIKWNPLYDDADALRLAVKLGIGVEYYHHAHRVSIKLPNGFTYGVSNGRGKYDMYEATRRAIVKAASVVSKNPEKYIGGDYELA